MTTNADAWHARVTVLRAELEADALSNDDEITRLWDLLTEATGLVRNDDTLRRTYIAPDGDTVEVKLTGEGVIADAFRNGRCVGTWSRTGDEMIEWITWLGESQRQNPEWAAMLEERSTVGEYTKPTSQINDTEAIDRIVRILNANDEWSSDEIELVASVVADVRGYTMVGGIAKFGPTKQ